MSVLIKGMDMPESCSKCFIWKACPVIRQMIKNGEEVGVWLPDNYRHNNCPLIEIPTPHGRLIDADALKKNQQHSQERAENIVAVAHIDWMPTIIEAEVEE